MSKLSKISVSDIDISFDFTMDCDYWNDFWIRGSGMGEEDADPDSESITLRQYHQALWSKPLPNGDFFDLEFGRFTDYLKFRDIRLSSDSIVTGFRYIKYRKMIEQIKNYVPDYKAWMEQIIRKTYTMGGMMIFPKHAKSINAMRGMNNRICDRWDLTLECIRRYYNGIIDVENNPIGSVLESDKAYFNLFNSFKEYVDFFFLNDCVTEDYSEVKMWIPTTPFTEINPLPKTVDEYMMWINSGFSFIESRNKRIADYIAAIK